MSAAALLAAVVVGAAYAHAVRENAPAIRSASSAACADQISLNNANAVLPILPADCYYQAIPRATCGPGSTPETGFQGEVPLAVRNAGFKGSSCNLKLIGRWQGQGASWQLTWYGRCAYYDQALPASPGQTGPGDSVTKGTYVGTRLVHPGSVAVDVTNPAHPKATAYLATPGLIHPWESSKVNAGRGLLAGQVQGAASLDVYDISKDCAHPKLLSSTPLKDFGHEGEWSPDGKTYWADYYANSEYHPVDMSEPKHPKEIMDWTLPDPATHKGHGLAISNDGMTGYFSVIGAIRPPGAPPKPANLASNGFIIADVSDIQLRRPNPKIRILSEVTFLDGGVAQMMIPITEKGKPYLVFVDELGGVRGSSAAGGNAASAAGWRKACADGLPPFGIARIFDISNPRQPKLVSRLTLQTDKPSNCQTAINEVIAGGQVGFSYDTHYCSVDRRVNATALACGYFNSGVRVFDIRNPAKPSEIAYYDPPSAQAKISDLAGSEHAQREVGSDLKANGLSADWCSAQSRFYSSHGTYYLWITCQDNGFQVLKFTNNAYPLKSK